MTEKFLRKTIQRIDALITAGSKSSGKKCSELEKAFIHQLYLHAPEEFFTENSSEDIFTAALGTWSFARKKGPNIKRKIRVFNPTKKKHGWSSERTVVELCMPDSPFLFDSITAELNSKGLTIYEAMHPVIRLKRNNVGIITKIFEDKGKKSEGSSLESIMHFQISHIADRKNQVIIEDEIASALHFVDLAVADWKEMLAKANEVVSLIDEKKLPLEKEYVAEARDFLNWAIANNFIFLGYCEYSFTKNGKAALKAIEDSKLGIFRAKAHQAKPLGLSALPTKSLDYLMRPSLLEITKSMRKSLIHRPVHMDYIGVKKFDEKGKVIGEHLMLGLFTSAVYFQSAKLIPIIRQKIDAVIKRSGFEHNSHNGKALATILESYPRDELLQISEDDLFEISMGIVRLAERPATRLFVRRDPFQRFVSCLVFIPRDRFSTQLRQKVQAILENAFDGRVTDYYTQVTESNLARVHVLLKTDGEKQTKPNIEKIEEELVAITNSWVEGLQTKLIEKHGEREGERLYTLYVHAFPESFKDLYHFGGTVRDITKMEESCKDGELKLDLDLYKLLRDDEYSYQLKLFHPATQVTLSDILPILENMGFNAIDELTFFVTPSHVDSGIWIHHFRLQVSRAINPEFLEKGIPPLEKIKEEFETAFFKIWRKEIENDALNKLVVRANMKWRDIMILRAYSKYIAQTAFTYSHDYVTHAVARYPGLAKLLIEFFHARFSPTLSEKQREKKEKEVSSNIIKALAKVSNVAEDRVIRQFFDTISATLRTNFFQKDENGEFKNYVSFKLNSKKVPNLPKPLPYAEIFVYSYDVEGVHLRGGKVARGGLRWSDRHEDFRTEILGLVKAQQVKNSVIVPVGSKGGFVVKHQVQGDRDAVMAQGIECYKTYLSGLLDLTDNIIKGKIALPKEVVRHDGDDPYLVVAADKGTATFSDIANGVSEKYNFWLADAFASGGSAGYDHKKMGITARGGWVSVRRHFAEMGIDTQSEDFTVIGIGDMSGDVFGNGMLLSKHIKLVGAFNHMHIFIDPTPDPEKSFKERQHLFNKPRSGWADYDKKLISKGGGIFERKSKSITLSPEAKKLLNIQENSLSPEDLIKKLVTAEVDLLWNGGIGTYVKAEDESHSSVGDKTNDSVRVSAKELRCKVVGEGGNLGFTQRARIEYAMHGGRINTDAIDNSAGVDCSDHEVNIKIALRKAIEKKRLTLTNRNKLLSDMTKTVADLVLRDNMLQTLALTITEQQSHILLDQHQLLMRSLEERNLLDRKIEFLPDEEELARRKAAKKGLTRPELSVLLAYSKIDIYDDLVNSDMPDDSYFTTDLLQYFPEAMKKKFSTEIESHELRREIIATSVANSIVNRMGSSFFHRMVEDTGMKGCDVARAYIIARDSFKLRDLWEEIENLGSKINAQIQTELHLDISRLVQRAVGWFLRNTAHPLDISSTVSKFAPGIEELSHWLDRIISPILKEQRETRLKHYIELNVPKDLAKKVANLEALSSACDIVHVTSKNAGDGKKLPTYIVGEVYYSLGNKLQLGWLRFSARKLISDSHWENLAVQTMTEKLYDQQMLLTADVIKSACKGDSCGGALETWSEEHKKSLSRYDNFIRSLRQHENLDNAMLTVAINRVDGLINS